MVSQLWRIFLIFCWQRIPQSSWGVTIWLVWWFNSFDYLFKITIAIANTNMLFLFEFSKIFHYYFEYRWKSTTSIKKSYQSWNFSATTMTISQCSLYFQALRFTNCFWRWERPVSISHAISKQIRRNGGGDFSTSKQLWTKSASISKKLSKSSCKFHFWIW